MENDPSNDSNDLWQQVADLSGRIERIEEALLRLNVTIPSAPPTLTALPTPIPPPRVVPSVASQPQPRQARPDFTEGRSQALERRLGSHIFNRVGILAVLVGVAWFLKYAFDNHWIGPLGRILMGLLGGSGIIVWSEWFRGRGYRVFSFSLKAIGSGVLYLSLWAAYDLYHIIPAWLAFLAMLVVTAWNGFMAWRQDAELLALYALIGSFLTPVLTSTGENHQLVLFGYVLIVDVTILVLLALRPWSRLVLGAFVGTVCLLLGWAERFYTDEVFALTACFTAVFVGLFAIIPWVVRPSSDKPHLHERDRLTIVLLPMVTACVGFLAFYGMLDTPGRHWAQPWAAVGFAAFYLALLRYAPARADARANVLAPMSLAMAVTFLTIAIPLKAQGYWLVTGWLVEGAALMWVARRTGMLLLRWLAIGALVLGVVGLYTLVPDVAGPVLWNARFGVHLVGIAAFAFVAWLAYQASQADPTPEGSNVTASPFTEFAQWKYIVAGSILMLNVLCLIAGTLEIHTYWMSRAVWSGMAEQFSNSVWYMLFGGLLLGIGFWKASAFLRWQALFLLVVSIGKVFLFDVSELSQGYRILSFLGLGVLLLTISFFYQRNWLGLRPSDPSSDSVETTHE